MRERPVHRDNSLGLSPTNEQANNQYGREYKQRGRQPRIHVGTELSRNPNRYEPCCRLRHRSWPFGAIPSDSSSRLCGREAPSTGCGDGNEGVAKQGMRKPKQGNAPTMDAVSESMQSHARWMERPPERHKFLQFLRQVRRSMHARLPDAGVAVGWANLFCVSHAGGSPTVAESFDRIQSLSQELLRAHIAVTDPDVILFTTGAACDRFLRNCFPNRTDSVAIEPRCLWQFRVGRTLCYRTSRSALRCT